MEEKINNYIALYNGVGFGNIFENSEEHNVVKEKIE